MTAGPSPARRRLPRLPSPRALPPVLRGSHVPRHTDPGLQPERTTMSWGRTVLALSVVALMFLRWYPEVGVWALLPAALAAAVGSLILLGQRRRYIREVDGILAERLRPAVGSVLALGGGLTLLSVVGLVATLAAGG